MKETDDNEAVAQRVIMLREVLGYSDRGGSKAFADFLGVSPQRVNNVESGFPLSRELALLMVRKVPGLSLDWLYLGAAHGLHWELARALADKESKASTGAG